MVFRSPLQNRFCPTPFLPASGAGPLPEIRPTIAGRPQENSEESFPPPLPCRAPSIKFGQKERSSLGQIRSQIPRLRNLSAVKRWVVSIVRTKRLGGRKVGGKDSRNFWEYIWKGCLLVGPCRPVLRDQSCGTCSGRKAGGSTFPPDGASLRRAPATNASMRWRWLASYV
jgi:hypothetical protein